VDGMLAGLLRTSAYSGGTEASVVAANNRLASTLVRRVYTRHECANAGTGKPLDTAGVSPCRHRNHRRDMEAIRETLEALELPGDAVAEPGDYVAPSAYATFDVQEAANWGEL
jgi:hypothetical protein